MAPTIPVTLARSINSAVMRLPSAGRTGNNVPQSRGVAHSLWVVCGEPGPRGASNCSGSTSTPSRVGDKQPLAFIAAGSCEAVHASFVSGYCDFGSRPSGKAVRAPRPRPAPPGSTHDSPIIGAETGASGKLDGLPTENTKGLPIGASAGGHVSSSNSHGKTICHAVCSRLTMLSA